MGGIPSNRFAIVERREQVLTLLCEGFNESEIARHLKVGQSTISRDLRSIKKESRKAIESIIEQMLPYEFRRCILSIQQVTKECWKIYHDPSGKWTNKNKIDALKLIKETNITRHEMLMDGPINLRALQMEQKVKELVEAEEMPQQNFMNLRLPRIKDHLDEDLT